MIRLTDTVPAEGRAGRWSVTSVRDNPDQQQHDRPLRIGIVGHGQDKFTSFGHAGAILKIIELVKEADIVVSGHSPMGGVDIWAEDIATLLEKPKEIYAPEVQQWDPPGRYGYKARNLDIAGADIVYCIVVDRYPPGYQGRRFKLCYHCGTDDHVKSGGCWTMKQAKAGILHIVDNR